MKLTTQQLQFFDTFGFLAFPGLLADSVEEITREFEVVFEGRGGGHAGQQHDGKHRSCIARFIDLNERLSALLDDERVHDVATSLLGDDFNYMGSDGNYYVGDTSWHSDGWHPEMRHIKIALYLDPLTRDTGALRFIPGSHRIQDSYAQAVQGVYRIEENWGIAGNEVPCVALETTPGDVVCFNHNLKHGAFGGNAWRRMFTLNLCQRYAEDNLQELRDYISGGARFWIDKAYGEAMLNTAGPGRMVHLEQVLANDGHLAGLAAQARATMTEPARG